MRTVITFFLLLCFHLWGDGNAVLGSVHNSRIAHFPGAYLHPAKVVAAIPQGGHCFFQQSAELPGQAGFLLFEEEDNEEEHSRKLKSTAEPDSVFFYATAISYTGTAATNVFPFCRNKCYPGNCRYLAHRVLRI